MAIVVGGEEKETSSCWLLLKHFPKWFTPEDKESLLKHFGAMDVIVMSAKGRMKNTVFAAFSAQSVAALAMGKLHQLEVFGSRLVVEYARSSHSKVMQMAQKDKWLCNTSRRTEADGEKVEGKKEEIVMPSSHEPISNIRYQYPPASHAILSNISNALLCVPEFYQQVLHLMNKMNLPPPFGLPTPAPPPSLFPDIIPLQGQFLLEGGNTKESEEEEGSELESDEEERVKRLKRERASAPVHMAKRRKVSYQQVKNLQAARKKVPANGQEDAEPTPPASSRGRIEVKVPSELAPTMEEDKMDFTVTYMESISNSSKNVQPLSQEGSNEESKAEMEAQEENKQFISWSEINTCRLTEEEMKESHLYRNYSPGEISTRLYIKNLAKQVEEKDLHYIFGRYINWDEEMEKNMFDIRLMQSGRMKGQAFIGLPSEDIASKALKETNGYLLHNKSMVVHFARSTKPKGKDQ